MSDPCLPPLYRLAAVDAGSNAFAQAVGLAAGTSQDGTVVWSRRSDRLDCAIVFRPEAPLPEALPVVYPVALGLGDAIGALAPPVTAVHFRWPDRIEVNGAFAGGLRAGWAGGMATEDTTGWLVVGVCVLVASPQAPSAERTTLQDEGCMDMTTTGLLESFSRHALAWINRWQDDGFDPVREAWLSRAAGLSGDVALELSDGRIAGRFAGLDERGNLLLTVDRLTRTVALADALRRPSWQL
ncbi:MAG: biotin/lipoate--protein ligase family protein [Dongiaceae bacterium]